MALEKVRSTLSRALRIGLMLLVLVLIGLEVMQVVLRSLLGSGMVWGRDLSTLTLFSLAWFGAPLLWLERHQLTGGMLTRALTGSRHWSRVLDTIVAIAGLALLFWAREAADAFTFIELPALGALASVKSWPVAIGAVLLVLAGLLNLLRDASAS